MKRLSDVVRFMVWRDKVAPDCDAWSIYGEVVRHGNLYGASTMLLADHAYRHSMQEALVLRFVEQAQDGKFLPRFGAFGWRGLPMIGRVRDLRR